MEGSDIFSKEKLVFNDRGYLIYKGTIYDQRIREYLTMRVVDTVFETAFWVEEYVVDDSGHVISMIERTSDFMHPFPEKITDSMVIDIDFDKMNSYPMVDSFFYDIVNRLRIRKRYRFTYPEIPMEPLFIDSISYNSKYQKNYTARHDFSFDQNKKTFYPDRYSRVEYQYKKNKIIVKSSRIENGRKILLSTDETIYFRKGLVRAEYTTKYNEKWLVGEYYYTFYKPSSDKGTK